MLATAPTILATSGGIREGRRTRWEFSALTEYAIELSGVTGRAPRMCFVATALGDNPTALHHLYEAAGAWAQRITSDALPDVGIRWERGRAAGTWDVPRLVRPRAPRGDRRLALVPYSNGVRSDSEEQPRPLFQRLIAEGALPPGYATDDGAGVFYRGADFVEAVRCGCGHGRSSVRFAQLWPRPHHAAPGSRLIPANYQSISATGINGLTSLFNRLDRYEEDQTGRHG